MKNSDLAKEFLIELEKASNELDEFLEFITQLYKNKKL